MSLSYKFVTRHLMILAVFLTLIGVYGVISAPAVNAGYADMPQKLPEDPSGYQFINLVTGNGNDPRTGKGAVLPDGYLKVYAQDSGARTISFGIVNRKVGTQKACAGYNINWIAFRVNSAGNTAGVGKSGSIPIGPSCTIGPGLSGGYSFTIPAGILSMTNKEGHAGVYQSIVMLEVEPTDGTNSKSATFQPRIDAGGRLGYAGGYSSTTYPSFDNIFGNVMSVKFRAPCGTSENGARITWVDDDYQDSDPSISEDGDGNGTPNQYDSPKARIYEYNPSSSTTTPVGNANQRNTTYGNGGTGGTTFDMRDGYVYELKMENVDGGNGIKFNYPYDSGDFYLPCPTQPPPAVTDVCSLIKIDLGNDGVRRYYKIYVNDNGSPGTVSGTPDYQGTAVGSARNPEIIHELERDNKIVSGMLEYTIILYNGDNDGTGRLGTYPSGPIGPCYTASCSIDVYGNVPGGNSNSVQAGQPFGVSVNITNTGINNLPATLISGYALSGTLAKDGIWGPNPDGEEYSGLAPARIGADIYPSGTKSRYFELNAPNDMNTHNLRMYPDYWGRMGIGGVCNDDAGPPGETITTFQRYDFNASASTSLDDEESPSFAYHNTGIIKVGAVDVDGTSSRVFYKRRNAANAVVGGPYNEFRAFQSVNYNDTYNVPPNTYTLGDLYCVSITLDRGHGWRSGNIYYNEGPAFAQSCPGTACPPGSICVISNPVPNQPYVRTYGEDIAAGGGFGTNCSRTNSGILGFMRPLDEQNPAGNRSGSGAQLAVMALGPISGFTSASLRNTAPTLPKGLTFAHDASTPDQTINNPLLGGYMDGNGWCMPDYFTATQFTDATKKDVSTSTAPINVNPLADQRQTVRNIGASKIRISGSSGPSYTRHHTIYVDGDVFIDGPIKYNTSYVGGLPSIPSFTLVVKGNIFIHKDVDQLDGLYIAQPNPSRPNTGRIYTCANDAGDAILGGPGLYQDCGANESGSRRQLTVNGSFLAERVVLNRTGYSLRDSRFREPGNNSRAAEVFYFSPEIYLSPPVFQPNSTSTSGEYDYLSVLAPFL